jgi:anti-sigma factor RsiW
MSDCASMREFLDDAALGAELPESVRVHLRTCGECAAELERRHEIVGRLDTLVAARANAQLPSDLGARVLAQIQRDTNARPRPPMIWRPVAAALVLAVVAFAILARIAFAPAPIAAPLVSWQSPTATLLEPVR